MRVKEDGLPVPDSGNVGITSEAMPAGNKEAWKFYLKSLYIFI